MINTASIFHDRAKGQVIAPIADLYISYAKNYVDEADFLVLDESQLGIGLLAPNGGEGVLQMWDKYDYLPFSDRLVSLDIERSIEFPFNTQMAMADFTLDNYDNYFTPGSGSTIDSDNLPGRPVKTYAGYNGGEVVPQFVGLTTKMPVVDTKKGIVSYHAVDFLQEIANQTLNTIVDMRDVRTDEVLSAIVEQFGVTSAQYDFEQGVNIIPFVFFDVGQNAGEAIQKLVQAENGKFWLDETGMLRFTHRISAKRGQLPIPEEAMGDYQIISATPGSYSDIINHVIISCDLREVQEFQTVYSKTPKSDSADTNWVVPPNSSITRSLSLEDPCYSVVTPTLGRATSVSWFTIVNSVGTEIPSGASISGTLTNNSYIVTVTNTNNFAVEVDNLVLWGEPAKVYDHLDYDSYEDTSVEQYGDHRLTIADNPFFQSYEQAVAFADSILSERAFYSGTMAMQIKGDFAYQLGDVFDVTGKYAGTYKIDKIQYHLEAGELETTIEVHKFPHYEYFILDESILDDYYVLG